MESLFVKNTNKSTYLKLIIFISLITLTFIGFYHFHFQSDKNENMSVRDTEIKIVTPSPVLEKSQPVKLSIPKINLNTDFETPLGLNEDREVETPKSFDKVGWYKYSPVPGVIGPAVVLRHVDSKNGPAVFFSLGQLGVGDDIFINRDDGSVAHFKVDFLERYEQKEFPTQKVYGNIDYAGLRLVTCSGIYLRGQQRYTHNLVVYAKLVE